MEEKIVFLNNFLSKEICVINENINKKDFLEKCNYQDYNIISENDNLFIGDYVVIERKKNRFHIVMPNESLEDIANKYNITKESIVLKNNITQIFVGQQLEI